MTPRFILTAIILLLSGCAAGTSPGDDEQNSRPLIQTDRSTYTAERSEIRLEDGTLSGIVRVLIGLRYTNATGDAIYLSTCNGINPPILEKKEGGDWRVAYSPDVPACLGRPRVIRPGETFEYDYRVEGFEPGGRVAPEFRTAVPGTYRLVWNSYEDWAPRPDRLLPLQDRISNEFELIER